MNKIVISLVLVVFVCCCFISCMSDGNTISKELERARYYSRKDSNTTAFVILDSLYRIYPNNTSVKLLLADVLTNMNSFDKAKAILENLIRDRKSIDSSYYLIGALNFEKYTVSVVNGMDLNRENLLQSALPYFDSAIQFNPMFFDAYVLKAKALHNLDEYAKSLSELFRAKKIFPDSNCPNLYIGVEKGYLGDFQSSRDDLVNFIRTEQFDKNKLSEANRFLAGAYEELGMMDSAISRYKVAIEIDPNYEYALMNYASLCARLKRREEACRLFKRAVELGVIPAIDSINTYCK